MKYIDIEHPGGPEVLKLAESDVPKPAPGQVLIKVAASGVNRLDLFQRSGNYPPPPGVTEVLGLEIAGEVVAVNGVETPLVSDQVCALVSGGGYAEYVVADAELCLPVPQGLTLVEAAAIPETFFTVWTSVFDRAGLKPGENFLVHGGSSGIGTTAIQLAKAFQSRVLTTAGSDEKCEACRKLGADLAINYKQQDFVDEIEKEIGSNEVNVILDMVAGEYINKNIRLATEDGRIVLIATLAGAVVEVNFREVMKKRLYITGSTLRVRPLEIKTAIAANLKQHVWPLLESGKVKPVIYQTLPLGQAAEAHHIMAASEHIGKIMLVI